MLPLARPQLEEHKTDFCPTCSCRVGFPHSCGYKPLQRCYLLFLSPGAYFPRTTVPTFKAAKKLVSGLFSLFKATIALRHTDWNLYYWGGEGNRRPFIHPYSVFKSSRSRASGRSLDNFPTHLASIVLQVHSQLKYLVDNHASVWACANFQELWPSPRNLKLFERYFCTLRTLSCLRASLICQPVFQGLT